MHDDKYQCHMAARCIYIPPTNYYLPAAQQEPYNLFIFKCLFTKNAGSIFGGERQKNDH